MKTTDLLQKILNFGLAITIIFCVLFMHKIEKYSIMLENKVSILRVLDRYSNNCSFMEISDTKVLCTKVAGQNGHTLLYAKDGTLYELAVKDVNVPNVPFHMGSPLCKFKDVEIELYDDPDMVMITICDNNDEKFRLKMKIEGGRY